MKRTSKSPQAKADNKRRHVGDKNHSDSTIYVTNLNSSTSTSDLKIALYLLFSSYGHVIAINAHRMKLRGRAFVSFGNPGAAQSALERLQGKTFLGQKLDLSFAKSTSERAELTRIRALSSQC